MIPRDEPAALEALLDVYRAPSIPELPPLHGGIMGYLGYDVIREVERLPNVPRDDHGLPDAVMSVIGSLAAVPGHIQIWSFKNPAKPELVNTFGFSGNAASVHGCFLGPNGRLYWCDGRHGHEFRDADGQKYVQTDYESHGGVSGPVQTTRLA